MFGGAFTLIGMRTQAAVKIKFIGCKFTGNQAVAGGAILIGFHHHCRQVHQIIYFHRSVFENNKATYDAKPDSLKEPSDGQLYSSGGGVSCVKSSPV